MITGSGVDGIARRVAGLTSRRASLLTLGGVALGAAIATTAPEVAATSRA